MTTDGLQLTPITEIIELRELRELYRRDWPEHCVGYYTLDNFIRWYERAPDIKNLHVYTLNGDWRSDGLFLIVDRYQLFVNSLSREKNAVLAQAISQLDWSAGYKVSSFLQRHQAAVMQVIEEKQLQLEYNSQTLMFYMPHQQALELKINCPPSYCLRPLALQDAETVNALWPNRHRGSLFLIRRLIAWNANMGVYDAGTGELVAWCLRLQGGFLGAVQTKESHQRLGLGSLATQATSRLIAEMGHDVTALVSKSNIPSRGMFSKLGFQVTDVCFWVRTLPTREGLEWPDGA